MSEKVRNIPKLRFPEFRDAAEWEEETLKKYVISHKGGAPLAPSDFVNEIGYEVIPKKAIAPNGVLLLDQDEPTFCSKVFFENNQNSVIDQTYLVTTLRDLVPSGPSIGYIVNNTFKKPLILAQGVYGFQIKENELDKNFIIQYSNRLEYRRLMQKMMVGSTQVHIRNNDFFGMPIVLPSIKEQQKIADCLSSIDELITSQAAKVEALKEHKKALMQQLFPREGETVPRLRFPEFQNAPEWEEKPLGDIFDFLRGSLFSKADIVQNGANKCIHYGELFTVYKEKISEIKSSTNLENGQFSQNGDILMPSSDVTTEGLATASAIFETGVIIGGDVNILRPKNQVSSLYVSYLLNFSKKEIMKLVTGTTVKHIYNKDVAKLEIRIPLQPEEQQKIADCLSSIDELITSQATKVEALKEHKKSLMQQLFPKDMER